MEPSARDEVLAHLFRQILSQTSSGEAKNAEKSMKALEKGNLIIPDLLVFFKLMKINLPMVVDGFSVAQVCR